MVLSSSVKNKVVVEADYLALSFLLNIKGFGFSVILKPKFLPQEAPKCTLMAATAITKAIEDVTGVKVGIKWPNDVYMKEKN